MRAINADHLKSILQEYVKREKSYVELGEFPTKLIASCMISGLEEAIAQIDSEPSAQPERMRGKWIDISDGVMSGKCSECGWECRAYEDDVYGMNYCPNCGADMRGEEDG